MTLCGISQKAPDSLRKIASRYHQNYAHRKLSKTDHQKQKMHLHITLICTDSDFSDVILFIVTWHSMTWLPACGDCITWLLDCPSVLIALTSGFAVPMEWWYSNILCPSLGDEHVMWRGNPAYAIDLLSIISPAWLTDIVGFVGCTGREKNDWIAHVDRYQLLTKIIRKTTFGLKF